MSSLTAREWASHNCANLKEECKVGYSAALGLLPNSGAGRGGIMTIEEAIKTALEFEKKVHALYETAAKNASDVTARRCSRLWRKKRRATSRIWKAVWPSGRRMAACRPKSCAPSCLCPAHPSWVGRTRAGVSKEAASHDAELSSLYQALAAEDRPRLSTFDGSRAACRGQALFSRFLEIEDGHGPSSRPRSTASSAWGSGSM